MSDLLEEVFPSSSELFQDNSSGNSGKFNAEVIILATLFSILISYLGIPPKKKRRIIGEVCQEYQEDNEEINAH